MRHIRTLLTMLLLVAMVGCSSTRDVTTDTAPAPEPTEETRQVEPPGEAPDETPESPGETPVDWYQLDASQDAYRGISVDRAYRELLADREPRKKVTVAIIDSGIDTDHEDLGPVIWTNEDEVPDNDVDDDGNGYVDDVHGWNFIGGRDGSHVGRDTYELTRLYARLSDMYADVDPDTLAPATREEYEYYEEIAKAFERKRQQYEQMYANLKGAYEAVRSAKQLLATEMGADTLALDTLRAATLEGLALSSQRAEQARNILLYMSSNDVTEAVLADQVEYVQGALEYGYNPDFNPRHIVGDDYDDTSERIYGNALVEGPDASHGTHVAGIVAADRDNDVGIDGIAGNVEIMVLRAVPDGDERDKDVANAIRYAVDNGADVINMSFGKGYSPQKAAVDEAVRYADDAGVLMIHAAGNDGANVDSTDNFPNKYYSGGGAAENWISVGAISHDTSDAFVAPFSNYGAGRVDIFAPGVDIYSTVPESKYKTNSGTSMAAPVVTGVAALVMAYYPDLSASQIKDVLLSSAVTYDERVALPGGAAAHVDFASLSGTGGVVNAHEALKRAAALNEQE